MNLNKTQRDTFRLLLDYENKELPSYGTLANLLNHTSRSTVQYQIQNFKNLGLIEVVKKILIIKKYPVFDEVVELDFLGRVSAGHAIHTEPNSANDKIKVLSQTIKNPLNSYAVEVTGDSMINAGILDGDMLLVDASKKPNDNDIVIALIHNSETTCKRLKINNDKIILKAENPNFKDIHAEEIIIQGVVVTLIRDNLN